MEVKPNKEFEFKDDDFLWRYLDLHKFFSFVITKSLFFTRLDNFEDPLEGLTENTLGQIDIYEAIPDTIEKLNPSLTIQQKNKILSDRKQRERLIKNNIELSQKTQFANCWFVSNKESFAMWNLYSNSDSVALRFDPNSLLNVVLPAAKNYVHDDFKIFLYGFVEYDDIWPFDHFKKSEKNIIHTAYKKDESYSHEREFRFATITPVDSIDKHIFFDLPLGDISKDDFKIFTNPHMEDWKVQNIEHLLQLFDLDNKIVKSTLRIKNK